MRPSCMVDARAWLAVIAVAACGGSRLELEHADRAPAASLPPAELSAEPFVIPGEHILMELSWHGIPAARFETAVGEPGAVGQRRAILVWSEMRSAGLLAVVRQLHTEVTTTVDLDSGYPLRAVGSFEALFRGATHNTVEAEDRRWAPGERVHNIHSTVTLLRRWDPPEGARGYFYGRVGRDSFRADVVAAGRELVRTKHFGTLPAVKVEGTAGHYRFALWFSDDRHRRPVRVDVGTDLGTVRGDLTAYERPDR